MKHLLNNLSEEEKNSIREQHEGGMRLETSRFKTLLENKSGNVKPLVEQDEPTEDMPLAPMDEDDSDYRMYDLPDVHQSIEDELEEMSDDEAIDYLKEIIEFCEDKLSGYDEESEDEEEDFGFAQHDGDFGGDDSDFEDEEELDLREFDELEEDETW
jgi:replicative superfamily II helicase